MHICKFHAMCVQYLISLVESGLQDQPDPQMDGYAGPMSRVESVCAGATTWEGSKPMMLKSEYRLQQGQHIENRQARSSSSNLGLLVNMAVFTNATSDRFST